MTARQKRLPLELKSPSLPRSPVEHEGAEFSVNNFIRVISDFGFQQIIPPAVEERKFFANHRELQKYFGSALLGVSGLPEKELILSPTYFLGILRNYLQIFKQRPGLVAKWFYVAPILQSKNGVPMTSRELGIFVLGEDSVVANMQLIEVVNELFKELGITGFTLEVNSLGCQKCRKNYQDILTEHFQKDNVELCDDCLVKFQDRRFPLWPCVRSQCQEFLVNAPPIVDFLDEGCRSQLVGVLETLEALNRPYLLNPLLNGQFFGERFFFRLRTEDGRRILGEGANYAPWSKYLGSEEPVPLLGFLTTLEKIWPLIPPSHRVSRNRAEVFLISLGEMAYRKILGLRHLLQEAGIKVGEGMLGKPGIKGQLKGAQETASEIALIVGQKEAIDETVILRDMRSGMQEIFAHDRIIEEVKKRLG